MILQPCNLLIRNKGKNWFINNQLQHLRLLTAICSTGIKNRNFVSSMDDEKSTLSLPTNSSHKNRTRIAIAQMRSTNDKLANLTTMQRLICDAKIEEADFLFFPECCDFVAENRQETINLSEPLNGPTVKQYCSLAKTHNIWLSLGGIHEKTDDHQKIFNTHIVINSEGEIVAAYRKLHLFDVDTPNFRFCESKVTQAGKHIIAPITTPAGRLGLQICYDMRFVESSLLLRKLGADILTYPSAFAFTTGKAHWEILLRARAIEMQCYVVAAAQTGFHNAKRQSWGHAMVVDPWGKILVEIDQNTVGIAVTEINLLYIETIRSQLPVFQHKRNDIYSLTGSTIAQLDEKDFEDRDFANQNIRKETIFHESLYTYAFTNLCCVVEGHVLIATKRNVPRLKDLSLDEITNLFASACKIQSMLEDIYQTTAATVTVQDGQNAGQTIPHVHVHVMPRRENDFAHNDKIYTKLEDNCNDKTERSIEARIKEAEIYRKYLSQR